MARLPRQKPPTTRKNLHDVDLIRSEARDLNNAIREGE
jgi:hypothetical protein